MSILFSVRRSLGHPLTTSVYVPRCHFRVPFDSLPRPRGFRNVVRVLLSEKGVKALGGTAEISHAICCVIQQGQVKTLDMLLSVEGTKRRKVWANRTVVVPGRLSDRKVCYAHTGRGCDLERDGTSGFDSLESVILPNGIGLYVGFNTGGQATLTLWNPYSL